MAKNKVIVQKKCHSNKRNSGLEPKTTFTAKNAERERSRVKSLRQAFACLQSCLPSVPPNTKLSKLDILILATNYISHLTRILSGNEENQVNINSTFDCDLKFLHPIKKWPMRSRLYSISESIETTALSLEPISSYIDSYYDLDSVPNNSIFII